MQAASSAAPKRRLRQRARLLVQGIDAAPAAEQTETGFDAGRVAPRVQADRQSAVIVDAASPAKADTQWIKSDSLGADTVKRSVGVPSNAMNSFQFVIDTSIVRVHQHGACAPGAGSSEARYSQRRTRER